MSKLRADVSPESAGDLAHGLAARTALDPGVEHVALRTHVAALGTSDGTGLGAAHRDT
jgi:hypothetical protein